jgi:hypothetical protein
MLTVGDREVSREQAGHLLGGFAFVERAEPWHRALAWRVGAVDAAARYHDLSPHAGEPSDAAALRRRAPKNDSAPSDKDRVLAWPADVGERVRVAFSALTCPLAAIWRSARV